MLLQLHSQRFVYLVEVVHRFCVRTGDATQKTHQLIKVKTTRLVTYVYPLDGHI